ncbi:MAG: hypothetical protein RJA70_2077 [Pseudomonadota bacterium]
MNTQNMSKPLQGMHFFTTALALLGAACGSSPNEERIIAVPSYVDECDSAEPNAPPCFRQVSEPLEAHCGSLDCHGNTARYFRLFGWAGVRMEDAPALPLPSASGTGVATIPAPPAEEPGPVLVPGGEQTTEEELLANYQAMVTLQPEVTSLVLARATDPGELEIISKGRGAQHHKGGVAMRQGDQTDICLTGWFSGIAQPVSPALTADQVAQLQVAREAWTTACQESITLAIIPSEFETEAPIATGGAAPL